MTLYATRQAPREYHCSKCKAHGVKLWRQYQTFADAIDLLCAPCAVKDQKKEGTVDGNGYLESRHGKTDQIGGLVPAIPTEDGETYWGYSSVPAPGVVWWKLLPTLLPDAPAQAFARATHTYVDMLDQLRDCEKYHMEQFIPDTKKALALAEVAMGQGPG